VTSKKKPPAQLFPDPATEYEQTNFTVEEVAEHWKGVKGCSRSNLMKRAAKENWTERRKIFRRKVAEETRDQTASAVGETLSSMNLRHIHFYRFVQREMLRKIGFPFTGEKIDPSRLLEISTADQAVRLLDIAVRGERLVRIEEPEEGLPSMCLILETAPPADRLPPGEKESGEESENGEP
jgi:hypothetical protein